MASCIWVTKVRLEDSQEALLCGQCVAEGAVRVPLRLVLCA